MKLAPIYYLVMDKPGQQQREKKSSIFSWKRCREDLLIQHSEGEFGELFVAGTKETTPHLLEIDARFVFPWRSAMMTISLIFMSLIFILIEHISRVGLSNIKTFMGLIMVGSIAIPLGLLCGMVEMNLKRNISWLYILWLVLVGGFTSIIFALITPLWNIVNIGTVIAGPIEESAKLLTVLLLVGKKRQNDQILQGLLYGAAVAAGFSIIESIGYAFETLISSGQALQYEEAINIMGARAITDLLGGHIAYTAFSCGALWMCMQGRSLKEALKRPLFLGCFALSIFLHSLWNLGTSLKLPLIFLLFPLFAWLPIMWLIKKGIEQIRTEQEGWKEQQSKVAAILWHKPLGRVLHGPYTLAAMKQSYESGQIRADDNYLIGSDFLRQSPMRRIMPQLCEHDATKDSWLESKNTAAFTWMKLLGMGSILCLLVATLDPFFILGYIGAQALIFLTLIYLNTKAWRGLHQPQHGTAPIKTGKRLWLKLFIPFYQFYWSYIFCVKLFKIYNEGKPQRMRIPLWIPKLYWWTCNLAIMCVCIMSSGGQSSTTFYLIFLILFYSAAAYLMAIALRRVIQKG